MVSLAAYNRKWEISTLGCSGFMEVRSYKYCVYEGLALDHLIDFSYMLLTIWLINLNSIRKHALKHI